MTAEDPWNSIGSGPAPFPKQLCSSLSLWRAPLFAYSVTCKWPVMFADVNMKITSAAHVIPEKCFGCCPLQPYGPVKWRQQLNSCFLVCLWTFGSSILRFNTSLRCLTVLFLFDILMQLFKLKTNWQTCVVEGILVHKASTHPSSEPSLSLSGSWGAEGKPATLGKGRTHPEQISQSHLGTI